MCISEKGVKPALTGFCRHAKYLGGALLALIIDLRWSNTTLTLILNESVEDRRNELLEVWVQHRFADLERINITVSLAKLLPLRRTTSKNLNSGLN